MIPKIIHQTAKTAEIPERWRGYQERVRSLHPGWEYRLWTDEDNLRLVEATSDRMRRLYTSLHRPIMKADLVRYLILDRVGGLYLDFDYEFLKPFNLLDERLVLPRESDEGRGVYLGNCILASEPGHPFWNEVYRELERRMEALQRPPLEDEVPDLTGPGLLTSAYLAMAASQTEICVPPRLQFHPRTPRTAQELEAIRVNGVSYGVHHCDGTWRARTLAQRAWRKLSTLKGGRC